MSYMFWGFFCGGGGGGCLSFLCTAISLIKGHNWIIMDKIDDNNFVHDLCLVVISMFSIVFQVS